MAKITPYGDDALLVSFNQPQALETSQRIHTLMDNLRGLNVFSDIVPGYDSLLAQYDPRVLPSAKAADIINVALTTPGPSSQNPSPIIDVPICYESEYGPDMDAACGRLKLTRDEIITLHSAPIYTVCMLGFIPGFTFLSAADKRLHMPRHDSPRARVPAGSVGIANWQTGIYGLASPGGWQILGRTPWALFTPQSDVIFRFKAADRIRFTPITAAEFKAL